MGAGKTSSAPRGVLVTWLLEPELKKTLIKEHFDTKDTTLLGEKSVMN